MAVACQTEKIESTSEYGILDVAISGEPSFDVVVKAPQTLSSTQAAGYNIAIYDDSDVLKCGPAKYGEFKAQVLPLGTYYVTAENLTLADAELGNGQMRLAGKSDDVTLNASALSQKATVLCEVANAKLSVVYDSSVSGMFNDDLKVVVSGGTTTGRKLTFPETLPNKETVSWYNPSTISYTISGTFKHGSKQLSLTGSRELSAKDNVKLLVKLNLDNGEISAIPEITVDVTMNTLTTIEEEFNPYE